MNILIAIAVLIPLAWVTGAIGVIIGEAFGITPNQKEKQQVNRTFIKVGAVILGIMWFCGQA